VDSSVGSGIESSTSGPRVSSSPSKPKVTMSSRAAAACSRRDNYGIIDIIYIIYNKQ